MQTPTPMTTPYSERKRKSKLRPARRKHNVVATVKKKTKEEELEEGEPATQASEQAIEETKVEEVV